MYVQFGVRVRIVYSVRVTEGVSSLLGFCQREGWFRVSVMVDFRLG